MRQTIIQIDFPIESASITEHVTDRDTGEDTITKGAEGLARLNDMLSNCHVEAYIDKYGTVRLGIVHQERTPAGRPRKDASWPEGLDTDQQRLEWLESTPVDEACKVLGVSRRTLYRRIDDLRASVLDTNG